jgi:hypothetical protein
MNFFSVKEFFYKLNTLGFILLLLPVLVFLFLHINSFTTLPAIDDKDQSEALLVSLTIVILIGLTIVHLLWQNRMKRLRTLNELARKMDGYFVMVLARHGCYTAALLLLATGFYLTHSIYFTGLFIVLLLALLAQWPGAARFCMQFQLKGSERDLVLHNQDLPRKPVRKQKIS